MSLDAIQRVTQAEQTAKQQKDAAIAENKQNIVAAQRAAQRLLESSRAEAEAEVRQMMIRAEQQAAELTKSVLAQTALENENLKEDARQNLDRAAELIVERVVKG